MISRSDAIAHATRRDATRRRNQALLREKDSSLQLWVDPSRQAEHIEVPRLPPVLAVPHLPQFVLALRVVRRSILFC
jgi:hypothetical protein